jgi:hypothetical protein
MEIKNCKNDKNSNNKTFNSFFKLIHFKILWAIVKDLKLLIMLLNAKLLELSFHMQCLQLYHIMENIRYTCKTSYQFFSGEWFLYGCKVFCNGGRIPGIANCTPYSTDIANYTPGVLLTTHLSG